MNLVKRLTASIVVITYQIFLKLIHGLRFLDQTSDMNVDHTSNPRASLLPSHPYREGFAFGSQVNVGSSCLRSQAGQCFDFTLLCAVQKTRVKSFQIRSRFSLPLYVQAVSLVFVCSSSLNVLGWFKKNVPIIFSFSMGICPNDLPVIIGHENCSPIHSSHWSDLPYSNRKLLR